MAYKLVGQFSLIGPAQQDLAAWVNPLASKAKARPSALISIRNTGPGVASGSVLLAGSIAGQVAELIPAGDALELVPLAVPMPVGHYTLDAPSQTELRVSVYVDA